MNSPSPAPLRLLLLALAFVPSSLLVASQGPPLVQIIATDPHASEAGQDPGSLTVIRTGPIGDPLTVSYRIGGTAGNGLDYESLSGTVSIPANASCAPIRVLPLDDPFEEGNETVIIALLPSPSGADPYVPCWPSVGAVVIEDDDTTGNQPPRVRLVNPPDGAVFLGPVDITLVARAWDPDDRVRTVEFFADGVSLGIVTNHPVVWEAAPLEGVTWTLDAEALPGLYPDPYVDLEASPTPDPLPGHAFRLVWPEAPAGDHVLTALATDRHGSSTTSVPVTIHVTPSPIQPVVDIIASDPVATEPASNHERIDTATFTLHRHGGDPSLPLPVFYRVSGTATQGEDYREIPSMAVIPAGHRSVEIVIEPLPDTLVEGRESVHIALVEPVCIAIFPPPPDCYRLGRHDQARAVILDNDPANQAPGVRLIRPEDGDTFMAPATITLAAEARDRDGHVVQVEFFEGTNSLGIVSNRLASALAPDAPVFVLSWPDVRPGRYVLTAEATDDLGATSISRPVRIHVTDRVPPPVVTIVAADESAQEGGRSIGLDGDVLEDTARFEVIRTGPTDAALEVLYDVGGTAVNGEDYLPLSGRVVIPVGASSASVLVVPIDDDACEGVETVLAKLLPSPCDSVLPVASPCYRTGDPYWARAVIRDNDVCNTNEPPKVAVVQPEEGAVFLAPADIGLAAEAADGDGFVRRVDFFDGNTLIGTVTNTYSGQELFLLNWPMVPAGPHELRARATDNRGASTLSDPVHIRVIEDASLTVVTVDATDPMATEGPIQIGPGDILPLGAESLGQTGSGPVILDTALFTIERRGRTNLPLTVHYRLSGTASNGLDYQLLESSAVIPAGSRVVRLPVFPLEDDLVEGTETVVLTLVPSPCLEPVLPPPPDCYVLGEPDKAVAYIRDNDLRNEPPKVDLVRPRHEQVFPAHADIPIEAIGLDPDGWVTRMVFFEGDTQIGEQAIYFFAPPPPGQLQHFSMIWSNVPPGRYTLTAEATDNLGAMTTSEPVRITVLEPCRLPVVTLRAIDPHASEQDPRILAPPDLGTIEICRSCGTNEDLTVYFEIGGTASNGMDYELLEGVAVIPAGETCVQVVVAPIDDDLVEGTETVHFNLVSPDCLGNDPAPVGCYFVGDLAGGTVFIRDNDRPPNDPPLVSLVSPPEGAVFQAPVDVRLVAEATDRDGHVESVEFFADGVSLGVVKNHPWLLDPIVAPEGVAGTEPLQDLAADADAVFIPLRPFTLIWSNAPPGDHVLTAVATDNEKASTTSAPVGITVLDPPSHPVVTIRARDPIASEGCPDPSADCLDTASFVVHRTGDTSLPLHVRLRIGGTAGNGEDYLELPHQVLIPAGASSAPILVEPVDDLLVEGRETVLIGIRPALCVEADPADLALAPDTILPTCYEVGRAHVARAIIRDNDTPPNEPPVVRLLEPMDGDLFRAPADIRLVASAFDGEGEIAQVEFFEGTNSLGVVTGPVLQPAPLDASIDPSRQINVAVYVLHWTDVPAGAYTLTAVATDLEGAESVSEPADIRVVEIQPPPVVTIEALDPVASEDGDLGIFTISRTGPVTRPLTVYYRVGGSAENGTDYDLLPGRLTIPENASSADLVVVPIDDTLCEGRESILIGLVPHPAITDFPPPRDYYRIGDPDRARGLILDNDICPPNQPPKVAIVRPDDGAVFAAPADIILCARAGDADGSVVRVDFFTGNTLIGSATADTGSEPELFCIRWPQVPAGAHVLTAVATDNEGAQTRSDPIHIRVIERPTLPLVSIQAVDPVGSEEGDPGVFVVRRTCCTNVALAVTYELGGSADNGLDYSLLSGQVIIPVGQHAAAIVVDPLDDDLVEGTEHVVASLVPTDCLDGTVAGPGCYRIGHPARDVVFIRDNDSAANEPPLIGLLSPPEGSIYAALADIPILAAGLDPDGWIAHVGFHAGDTLIGEQSIDFFQAPPPGELQTFEMDWLGVPPGDYVLTAEATDNRGAMTVSGPIHIRVIDPCVVPVVFLRAIDPIAHEGPNVETATLLVHRSCLLDEPLTVSYEIGGTADNGVDYVALSGVVTLPAGAESAPLIIEPIDDDLAEGIESVVIRLLPTECANPTAGSGCYLVGEPGGATAYIRDDENLPPQVALLRPIPGQVFIEPATVEFLARAVDPDGWVTQVEFLEGETVIGGFAILVAEPPPPGQAQFFEFAWPDVPAGTYQVSARVTDNRGATARSELVDIVVEEAPGTPVVTLDALDGWAQEGTENTARFRISRTGGTDADLTVHFQTGGTAGNGTDYEDIGNQVTIPAGRRAVDLFIRAREDNLNEGVETVVIHLAPPNPSTIPPAYLVGDPAVGAAIITDAGATRPPCGPVPGGMFHVCIKVQTDGAFRLVAGQDFESWKDIGLVVPDNGYIHYVDPAAASMAIRFYVPVPTTTDPDAP